MTTATATATALKTYTIDAAHSEATFQVRHLITKVRGRFPEFEGTITFAPDAVADSSVVFTIQTKSIDTNQAQRDEHLRAADFFDVAKFPVLTFTSTSVMAALARPQMRPTHCGMKGRGRLRAGENRPSAARTPFNRSSWARSSPMPTGRISLARIWRLPRPDQNSGRAKTKTR